MITRSLPIRNSPDRQTDLPLFRPVKIGNILSVDRLVSILSDGRWHTAKELKVHGFRDRELRLLKRESKKTDNPIFSYPGSPGYKLFDFVTEEEFPQCVSLKNQAEEMLDDYRHYQCLHHRRYETRGGSIR